MTLADLRLAWRLQRFELAALVGAGLVLSVVAVAAAWQLDTTREALRACNDGSVGQPLSAECRSLVDWANTLSGVVGIVGVAATAAPFGIGLFLGAPLVAREIERRTAPIAWSLSPSRRRWFGSRVIPLVVVLTVVLLVLGQASDALLRAGEQNELGFRHLGMHGPLLAARGLAVFGIGVLVGLAVGRVLPAILITGLAMAALFIGIQVARDQLMRADAVWLPMGDQAENVAMVYDTGFRIDETDEVMTWQEAYEQFPDDFSDTTGELNVPGTTPVWLVVRPELYPLFVAREAGAMVVVLLLVSGLALVLVESRRPE